MRADEHAGCVMNDRRKHRDECGVDESMYVHSEQRRNIQYRALQESTGFNPLPPRPATCGDTRLSFRNSDHLGLQVQGFCCPLQPKPRSGRATHRATPQSSREGDERLVLLSSLKGRLETRAAPTASSRSKTGGRPEMTLQGGAFIVSRWRGPDSETEETPSTPCDNKGPARHGQPGATKVSELHLYLPSSLREDEEQGAEAEEMRTSAEETGAQECD